MMLRSASTPSLVSSFTESPRAAPQVSCSIHAGFSNFATDIRRAQSAGNLEEVFNVSALSRQSSKRLSRMNTLEAIPSYHPSDDEEEIEDYMAEGNWNGFCDVGEGKMYLAAGIGVNALGFLDEGGFGGGGGGGGSCKTADEYREGGDSSGLTMESHYKNMVSQWPGNPLFLRNYAHFLYKTKGDLVGAEEYYSRAILAEPDDGEALCEYGNVIWELHQDKERARSYFQRALRAPSAQSNIIASYASFLWDLGEDEDEDDDDDDHVAERSINPPPGFMHRRIIATATV